MPTKRPHFVPRTYLRAWADSNEQVAYRRRGQRIAVTPNITNVAVASGIYGTGELAESREVMFQLVEDEWESLRQELITAGPLRGERRSLLALYTAIQLSRTAKHSATANFITNVAATTAERPIPLSAVHDYLAALDGSEPDEAEVEAAWTFISGAPGIPTSDETLTVSMDVAVSKLAPQLETMQWHIEKFTQPALLTSDCPVTSWRRPDPSQSLRGVGLGNADEVRFPLSPGALLVMTPTGRALPERRDLARRVRAVNNETCGQCHQFVVGTVQTKSKLERLALAERPPRLRFRTGPLMSTNAAGIDEPAGEVLHMYVK